MSWMKIPGSGRHRSFEPARLQERILNEEEIKKDTFGMNAQNDRARAAQQQQEKAQQAQSLAQIADANQEAQAHRGATTSVSDKNGYGFGNQRRQQAEPGSSYEKSHVASFVDDLGADSLDTVELVMALEEEFDTEIPDEEAEKITTVKQANDYVNSNSK